MSFKNSSAYSFIKKYLFLRKIKKLFIFYLWNLFLVVEKFLPNRTRPLKKLLWIPTEKIKYAVKDRLVEGRKSPFQIGKIIYGDWDNNIVELGEIDFFSSSYQHYALGVPWNKTDFYHRVCEQIKGGTPRFGCDSIESWDARLKQDDELYEEIKRNGYKSQEELGSYRPWDEIRVCIGRNGDFYFVDGRHRLTIAKILKIKTVPVIVACIHGKWYEENYK